jgi:hypothetical protein
MMKLRTPADSSYAAHCYDREFGTSRTDTIMLLETIALREAVPGPFLPRQPFAFVSIMKGKAAAPLAKPRGS